MGEMQRKNQTESQELSTQMLTQASVRKTLDSSNYFNQEGIYYNLLGIWEIMTKITAACMFAKGFKICPLIQRKIN